MNIKCTKFSLDSFRFGIDIEHCTGGYFFRIPVFCQFYWRLVSCTDVSELVTSSLNKSLNLLLSNGSVIGNVTTRKTSPTDEYFRYFIQLFYSVHYKIIFSNFILVFCAWCTVRVAKRFLMCHITIILRICLNVKELYFSFVCCRLALMNEQPGINIENLGDVRWHLCLCLVLAWILVIIFVSRGIQSTGKVVTFEYSYSILYYYVFSKICILHKNQPLVHICSELV